MAEEKFKKVEAVLKLLPSLHSEPHLLAFVSDWFENGDETRTSFTEAIWDMCKADLDEIREESKLVSIDARSEASKKRIGDNMRLPNKWLYPYLSFSKDGAEPPKKWMGSITSIRLLLDLAHEINKKGARKSVTDARYTDLLKQISEDLQTLASRLLGLVRLSFLAKGEKYEIIMDSYIQELLLCTSGISGRKNLLDLAMRFNLKYFLGSATIQNFVEWKMNSVDEGHGNDNGKSILGFLVDRSAMKNVICRFFTTVGSRMIYTLFPQEWWNRLTGLTYEQVWTCNALHWMNGAMYFVFVLVYTFTPWEHMTFFKDANGNDGLAKTSGVWPWGSPWPAYGELAVQIWVLSMAVYEVQQIIKMLRDAYYDDKPSWISKLKASCCEKKIAPQHENEADLLPPAAPRGNWASYWEDSLGAYFCDINNLFDLAGLGTALAVLVARAYAFLNNEDDASVCKSRRGHQCAHVSEQDANGQDALSTPLTLQSIAVLCLWARLLLLFNKFARLGPLLQSVMRMVTHDFQDFVLLYAPFLLGFAAALTTVYTGYEPGESDIGNLFGTYWRTLRTLLWAGCIGAIEGPLEAMMDTPEAAISTVLFTLYLVVVAVLLMNMLIAVMAKTFDEVYGKAKETHRFQRVQLLLSTQRLPHSFPPFNLWYLFWCLATHLIKKMCRCTENPLIRLPLHAEQPDDIDWWKAEAHHNAMLNFLKTEEFLVYYKEIYKRPEPDVQPAQ